MDFKIETLEEMTITGAKEAFSYKNAKEEIPGMWAKHMPQLGEKLCVINDGNMKGLLGVNANMRLKDFDYYIAVTSSQTVEGLETLVIPKNTYVVFQTTMDNIANTYTNIWKEWLPSSQYDCNMQAPQIEHYPSETECIIYIPIKNK